VRLEALISNPPKRRRALAAAAARDAFICGRQCLIGAYSWRICIRRRARYGRHDLLVKGDAIVGVFPHTTDRCCQFCPTRAWDSGPKCWRVPNWPGWALDDLRAWPGPGQTWTCTRRVSSNRVVLFQIDFLDARRSSQPHRIAERLIDCLTTLLRGQRLREGRWWRFSAGATHAVSRA